MKFSSSVIILISAINAIMLLGGCGGGDGGGVGSAGKENQSYEALTSSESTAFNSYSLSADNYGLQNATFLSATNSNGLFVMRAAIAKSMADPDFRTVFRIDVLKPQLINGHSPYAIGGADSPVEVLFFNGHKSTLLNTVSGSIYFSSFGVKSGDVVAGNFNAVVEDDNFDIPRPTYSIRVNFSFVVNSSAAVVPTQNPVPPEATAYYDAKCGSCHSLGSHDTANSDGAPDLAQKGCEIYSNLTG
ncbi:MAG TPA: hypothetical protein VMC44_02205, partial [Geobacteraceae bacterium]|nr:hypothetical protein [Geobacteraceae bacterium]